MATRYRTCQGGWSKILVEPYASIICLDNLLEVVVLLNK